MPKLRLAGELRQVGTGSKADLRLCRLPVRPQGRLCPTDSRPVAEPSGQNIGNTVTTGLSGPAVDVSDRFTNSHRKQVHLGRLHMRPIQWHLKNHWRITESLEKVTRIPWSLHPHLQWWLQEDNVLKGQPLHPIKHALQIFTHCNITFFLTIHEVVNSAPP